MLGTSNVPRSDLQQVHMSANCEFQDLRPEDITDELTRVLVSSEFRRSLRMVRFLEFVVTRTLSGYAHQLKEYVIGTEVFEKPSTFDPGSESIVRVEARRLRRKLEKYYSTEGAQDLIVIQLKAGGYVPTFCRRLARDAVTGTNVIVAGRPGDGNVRSIVSVEANLGNISNGRVDDVLRAAETSWRSAQSEFDRIVSEMRTGKRPTADLIPALVTSAEAVRIAREEYNTALRENAGAPRADREQFRIAGTEI
jgi:hypothetical protein